jgi:nucleotide-binding universal stress UspA family protein
VPEELRYRRAMKTILAPVDFSGVTEAVIAQASALATTFGGRVLLLHVMQPPVITSEYAPFLENIGEIVAVGEKAAAKQLIRLQEQLQTAGIPADTLQYTGAPVTFILQQAEKNEADYIVMGSHGHTAFYDLLVGSTTHGVLQKSPCPVVVVPDLRRLKKAKARPAKK